MKQLPNYEDKLLAKFDRLITLLEDLFILEAARIGMNKEALRQVLRIDKKRIGRIAKHVQDDEGERAVRPRRKR